MMMFGAVSSTASIALWYCSAVAPWTAQTCIPPAARAAATSSCVESGLLPVTCISAPPISMTRQSHAVFASRCTESATRSPARGFVSRKSSAMAASTGICPATQRIFFSPSVARVISAIWFSYMAVLLLCIMRLSYHPAVHRATEKIGAGHNRPAPIFQRCARCRANHAMTPAMAPAAA